MVYGEKHTITGNIVCADITTVSSLDSAAEKELVARVKQHCREKLQRYKVPLRVNIVTEQQHTERFKKSRR
jgi:acyl-coenzyme A synthetase/AMP-(fatty) acid ligase